MRITDERLEKAVKNAAKRCDDDQDDLSSMKLLGLEFRLRVPGVCRRESCSTPHRECVNLCKP